MATFYIQLENKLLKISGDLTAENISKALGYVPVDSSTMSNYATKDEVSDLVDMSMVEELSQRVDNITFDSLKGNPFLQDGSGELNIVDESGNIIAKIDAEGIHSVDFIAGDHALTNKMDIVDNLVRIDDTDGELDDVPEDVCVKYVTQSLTEEQKNQVRENLGIPSMEYVMSLYQELLKLIQNNNGGSTTIPLVTLDTAVLDNSILS